MQIALVGDYSPTVRAHAAIPVALRATERCLGISIEPRWLATARIRDEGVGALEGCDGVWCIPGSPYADMVGAISAIRFARETKRPFLGTCGGFQHALIEYARNVAGLTDADHAESNPEATTAVIVPLACSLIGAEGRVILRPGSRAATIYGRPEAMERYHCRYGLSPSYRQRLVGGPLCVSGWDEGWEVRIVELDDHPFFVATLFQPELSSTEEVAHPLIVAFAAAAAQRGYRVRDPGSGKRDEAAGVTGASS